MRERKKARPVNYTEILQNAHLRERLGLSIAELAEILGVARQTLYRWERGEAVPSAYWRKRWRGILSRRMKKEGDAYEVNKQESLEN